MQLKAIIDGKVYDGHTVDDVSIRQALAFDRECAEAGLPVRWADIERIRAEVLALETPAEQARHPEALLLTAVMIWATMLAGGEQVTFVSAIDRPLGSFEFIDADPRPTPAVEEAAPDDPRRARPDSGRASAGGKRKHKGRSRKQT